ncbi:MAG TPA: hypothetical protein VNL77_08085 [Roseiflexaceae bacterium]|nr:hypothetical protein [Roseiflexaceae bacterium]
MSLNLPPSLEAFLAAPLDDVRAVAPATAIYAVGGTRRQAVLAGIAADGDDYPRFSFERLLDSLSTLFRCGVRHAIVTILQSPQMAEVGRYRERLMHWLAEGTSSREALAAYRARGWRVRLIGGEAVPALDAAAATLRESTPHGQATVWYYTSVDPQDHWRHILAAGAEGARTQAEVIRAICGEDVPPAELYLAFGKPLFGTDLFPLALAAGTVQCYWTQRPGYDLPEADLRRVLYDYAFTRRTWRADKLPRYAAVSAQRGLWNRGDILGIGRRVGGFWYPVAEGIPPEESL